MQCVLAANGGRFGSVTAGHPTVGDAATVKAAGERSVTFKVAEGVAAPAPSSVQVAVGVVVVAGAGVEADELNDDRRPAPACVVVELMWGSGGTVVDGDGEGLAGVGEGDEEGVLDGDGDGLFDVPTGVLEGVLDGDGDAVGVGVGLGLGAGVGVGDGVEGDPSPSPPPPPPPVHFPKYQDMAKTPTPRPLNSWKTWGDMSRDSARHPGQLSSCVTWTSLPFALLRK
ncbi:hypothetical protein HK101_007009 [Irineochytrium annulatum]|nr:hypothetical protein HK101_007009 [Irineochytrium annulatum]